MGFPHSDTSGSLLASSSPERFVGRYVLLRLCVPRYPPLALCSLTYSSLSTLLYLTSLTLLYAVFKVLHVGYPGLEPGTSPLSGVRSNHLSYRPGFACLRTAWTALQLSLNRSRTCVRSLFHSTCALPAAPNPAPNPETDSVFVANRYRACIDPFALFISQPSNSCGL